MEDKETHTVRVPVPINDNRVGILVHLLTNLLVIRLQYLCTKCRTSYTNGLLESSINSRGQYSSLIRATVNQSHSIHVRHCTIGILNHCTRAHGFWTYSSQDLTDIVDVELLSTLVGFVLSKGYITSQRIQMISRTQQFLPIRISTITNYFLDHFSTTSTISACPLLFIAHYVFQRSITLSSQSTLNQSSIVCT